LNPGLGSPLEDKQVEDNANTEPMRGSAGC